MKICLKKLCLLLVLFFGFLSFFFLSENASALVPNNMASSAVVNQSFATPSWHTTVKNHNHALPITMLNYNETGVTLQVSQIDVSAFVSPTQKGQYWNGSFVVTLRFAYTSNQTLTSGLLLCNRITQARLKPEQGTVVSQQYKIQDCKVIPRPNTSTTGSLDLNLKVQAAGKLSASTTVSSYVLQIISSRDEPFFTGNLKDGYWELLIPTGGLDINFNLNDDPNTTGQGDINQNITNIYDQNQREWEQDQQDRDNVSNTKEDGDDASNDAQTDSEQAMSNFFGVINQFIGALQTPATDCKVRSDLGHIDLGVLDFCSGKPNEFIPIIRVAILLVMAIPVYLICRRIIDDFINITVFAQGGK